MNLLILGRGKTGTLVGELARERKHHIQIAGAKENAVFRGRFDRVGLVGKIEHQRCLFLGGKLRLRELYQ